MSKFLFSIIFLAIPSSIVLVFRKARKLSSKIYFTHRINDERNTSNGLIFDIFLLQKSVNNDFSQFKQFVVVRSQKLLSDISLPCTSRFPRNSQLYRISFTFTCIISFAYRCKRPSNSSASTHFRSIESHSSCSDTPNFTENNLFYVTINLHVQPSTVQLRFTISR